MQLQSLLVRSETTLTLFSTSRNSAITAASTSVSGALSGHREPLCPIPESPAIAGEVGDAL